MSTPAAAASALQTYMNALYQAINDPAQAISIFSQLTTISLPPILGSDAISIAQQTVQTSLYDLWRRNSIAMLAQASAAYQPTSYDDAENIRNIVTAVIDDEITIAGDEGDDDTFLTLKQLRAAVVQDLTSRGAALAPLVTFKQGQNMPALALAYKFYQNTVRADQLIAFADPEHPAFMPVSFQALAT